MATRHFAAAVAVFLYAPPAAEPVAAQSPDFGDGCTLLGEVIRRATVSELYRQRGEVPSAQTVFPRSAGGLQSCASTSSVVSSAYAKALAQFGLYVRWSYLTPDPGYACLRRDIGTCHPFPDPMGPRLSPPDRALIGNRWNRVRNAVTAYMPWGTETDMSYFRVSALAGSVYVKESLHL